MLDRSLHVCRDDSGRDETGATATEYAILVGFMVFAMILGLTLFGSALNERFGVMATIVGTFDDHF